MKEKLNQMKNFVKKHQLGLTVVATGVVASALSYKAKWECDEFLKEKGLYDEYYHPEEDSETA